MTTLHGLSLPGFANSRLTLFTQTKLVEALQVESAASEYPWNARNFLSSINAKHLCVGVEISDEWAAHAVLSRVLDESELLILTVSPQFQRRGIASKLMLEVIKHLSETGTKQMHLEVRRSNLAATQLYLRLGFKQVGTRKNYYPKHRASQPNAKEDAVLFTKILVEN